MIFHDEKKRRKIIFRLIIILLVLSFMALSFDIALGIMSSSSSNNYHEATKDYYHYYYSSANNKKIALTFDDGPTLLYTTQIIEILKKNEVPATFFFVGKNVIANKELVKKAHAAGFEIGNHSFSHKKYIYQKEDYLKWELVATNKLIEDITGEPTLLYRPPYLHGIGGDPTINPYSIANDHLVWAAKNGFIPTGVDIDPKDFLANTPEELLRNISENVAAGKIILLHDGDGEHMQNTVNSLERIINYLKSEGYSFTTASELLGVNKDFESGMTFKNTLFYQDRDLYTNDEVTKLQEFLLAENVFDYTRATGYYGDITKAAVSRWQKEHAVAPPLAIEENPSNRQNNLEFTKLKEFFSIETNFEYPYVKDYPNNLSKSIAEKMQNPNTLLPIKEENFYGNIVDEKTQQEIYHNTLGNIVPDIGEKEEGLYPYQRKVQLGFVSFISSTSFVMSIVFKCILGLVIIRVIFLVALLIRKMTMSLFGKKTKKSIYRGKVDVIVPAWNEQENIRATLESLLQSTYPLNKILVIDDGSTDNTVKIAKSVRKKYPKKIKVVALEKNAGKANALNVGFDISKSEVVIALDADTIFCKDTVTNLVKHFNDKTIGAVAGNVKTVRSFNLLSMFQSMEYIIGQNIEKKLFDTINAIGVVPGAVGAWRKKTVIECGGYSNETLVEDQDLTLAILKSGKRIVYEPNAISYTETPRTISVFMKQRFRWIYGTMQCFWKNKKCLFSSKHPSLSWVILPNILFYNILVPLVSPIIDILAILSLVFGMWEKVVLAYLLFTILDLSYASIAFWNERKNVLLLAVLPLQRIFYRQILYFVIIKSIVKAIEGGYAKWVRIQKTGFAQKQFLREIHK